MENQILEALGKLDPLNESHWTRAGLPDISTLLQFTGLSGLKRADVDLVAPGFNRDTLRALSESATQATDDLSPPDATTEGENLTAESPLSLSDERARLQAKLDDVQRQIHELQGEERRLLAETDFLTRRIEVEEPNLSTMQTIQAYLKSENEKRFARTESAPIDLAMRRVTRRGAQRPTYPTK